MREFTTSRGVTVKFVPIQMLLDKISSDLAEKQPQVPTYEIKTVTGVTETHEHDETTVKTDEEKAALAKHRRDFKKWEAERGRALLRAVLMCGISVDMPSNTEWINQHLFLGLTVPDDPLECKFHWLETEALGTTQDLESVMAGVMAASGASEDKLRQAEASFRRAMGQSDGQAASGPASTRDGEGMVLQPPLRADESSGKNGSDSNSVRRARRRR